MKNEDLLTNELVRYILAIFGLSEEFIPNLIGITLDKFKKTEISIDYEDNMSKLRFPVYSASVIDKNIKLKVEAIYINNGNDYEFCAVFKCDDLETYGLKISSDAKNNLFLVSKNKGEWIKPSMTTKLMACSGLEILNDAGIAWKPEPVGDLLHSCLLDLIEM